MLWYFRSYFLSQENASNHFDELIWRYSHRIHGYPIVQNTNKKKMSIIMVTLILICNKGSEVVREEKLKYPVNIKATLFSANFPCFFCHHLIPPIKPINKKALNTMITYTAFSAI